jgi:hypothetical protein
MNLTIKYALIGLLLLATGAIYICFFSFKYDTTITFVAYGFLLLGWGFITYKVIGDYFLRIKNATILKTIFIGLFLISIWLFSALADKRVAYILQYYPSKTTVATVLTTWKGWRNARSATLRYYTANGIVQQEIGDGNHRYRAGQSYLIKYSVKDPDIFVVIKEVNID